VNVGKKIYVGSLPYSVNEQKLAELFAPYGTVTSVKIISDKYSGQSKGFGFVEMDSSEEAQKAITALNGTQLEGRTLVVNEARPMESRPRSPRGGRGSGGGGRRDRRF
jgi:RNA recognition motif-containing protein